MDTTFIQKIDGVADTPFISSIFKLDDSYRWLKLSLSFNKKGWYSIFVWDPNNTLRIQSLYMSDEKVITISNKNEETSFSCVAGDVPIGEWRVEILTPSFKNASEFSISIEYGDEDLISDTNDYSDTVNWTYAITCGGFELDNYKAQRVHNDKKAWYKGDFHTHTTESDGKMSVQKNLDQAKVMGLDFFVATDHNILPTKWLNSDVLVIPGIEVTSSKGHFNALGLTKWVDWRPTCKDGGMETEAGMNRIIEEAKEAGAVISMNHPMLKPWEWQLQDTRFKDLDVIEIWNDPTYKDNPQATEEILEIWNKLWNDGHTIYGIGGSDSHLLPSESYEEGGAPSLIGDPATYVYAENLSAAKLLQAVCEGKVYVSRGPVLDFTILANGKEAVLGDRLGYSGDGESHIEYRINYKNVQPGASIHWILNGEVSASDSLVGTGSISRDFSWEKNGWSWLRFEIRSANGILLAFGNPIFEGEKETSFDRWGDVVAFETK
ncbi:CehA/McbA family metallohydrolase [Bacillus tianshenii]|uniref:CehA/McbA family metallohydrolase n=1 Tax=Sutcliffiella tianshenii TaxID=1463404 RepID=UPI001CD2EC51|nr:CehA/McbA family metallohydrolase [Bacillus tianshenii]MCA1320474.1 CehA/McbA family metallohydrolase [Bacillus tianshenii]